MHPPEVRQTILERIASGESLRSVCKDSDMPGWRTVLGWVSSDKDFEQQYARAMQMRADAKFEELDEVAEEAASAESAVTVQGLRLKADIIKWQTAKMAPKKYGDRVELEHTGNFLSELAALNARTNRNAESDPSLA